MKKITTEQHWPWMLSLLLSFICLITDISFPIEYDSILTSGLTVSGILVGFLVASKTVIMTIKSKLNKIPILAPSEKGEQNPYYEVFAGYIQTAVFSNILFCILNFIGFFLQEINQYFSISWIFLFVLSFSCFIRVFLISMKIFKLVS